MAANRKLQGEIDRTLKKVQEGVEVFDEIWEKVYSAQNQNQKEKFEAELKSQIKKLQRYRDDIKTWITNSDIKDKRPLTDARTLIEKEMERFKVCEKEFKTKAFSKEGLSQAAKEDPKEKERNRVRSWVRGALEIIAGQKDVYEAELETINSAKKKKKDSGAGKWEDLIERCRFHEERLELLLRLIDNESLTPEDIDNIREQLDYLLEQMQENNYDEVDGIDDDSIYEELGLDDLMESKEEEAREEARKEEAAKGKDAAKTPDKKSKKEKEEEEKKEKERKAKEKAAASDPITLSINSAAKLAKPVAKDPPAAVAAAKLPAAKEPTPKLPAAGAATAAAAVAAGPATAARGKAATASVPLTAAAAASVVRGRSEPTPTAAQSVLGRPGGLPAPAAPGQTAADAARGGRKDDPQPSAAAALLSGVKPVAGSAAAAVAGGAGSGRGGDASSVLGLPPPGGRGGAMGGLPIGLGGAAGRGLPPPGSRADADAGDGGGGLPGLGGADVAGGDDGSGLSLQSLVPGGAGGGGRAAPSAAPDGAAIPEELEGFEELLALAQPTGGGGPLDDPTAMRQMLSMSLFNMPEPSDSERPRTYVPRNPYPTPNSFPQTPAAVFDAPSTFDKFDTDTLFFIFYYQQGTYQQYLAARELKKQSWRYHKKYLTWFQRHEEPKVTAEDYEKGTYVYFDYETGWCQRIKSDFTFEYGFLEDELQV